MCVILISTVVFEKFRMKGGSYEPMYIRFADYTKEDVLKILLLDFNTMQRQVKCQNNEHDEETTIELSDEFFLNYAELIYNIFNHNCKDLNELRYFSALLLPLYIKPIQEGTSNENKFIYIKRIDRNKK